MSNPLLAVVELLREENEKLRGQLALYTDVESDWVLPGHPDLPLTPFTRKVLHVLFERRGKTVRPGALYQLLYSTRTESQQPNAEVVPVLISKLRRSLRGTEWRIDTVWSAGWRLMRGQPPRQSRPVERYRTGNRSR